MDLVGLMRMLPLPGTPRPKRDFVDFIGFQRFSVGFYWILKAFDWISLDFKGFSWISSHFKGFQLDFIIFKRNPEF